ncbi:hypothetical protein SAMN04488065_1646 [Haloplanus vescus]|uniref:Uncharacterized protein n=1 Tax=Haloplanus vescus TaxID=555874 RepID=A0A1H3Y619_9EURY|nr:hypothetical protein [Haloplanus vescus]SEA06284.1 hypothetical protein SAMN04488065_1646 [Haloplanus vescus]
MDSNSLPMVPDLRVVSKPVRYLVLGVLGAGVLLFAVLVVLGTLSTPTVTVEATVVDSVPADATDEDVSSLSDFPADSPIRAVVEDALENGTASATATTAEIRAADAPGTEWYVRHDGRVVRVEVNA